MSIAIATDAQEDTSTIEATPVALSARELKLEELIKGHEAANGIRHDEESDDEDIPHTLDPKPINYPDPSDPFLTLEDGKRALRLKINGEEVIEPLDKAIVELQKLGSADARLREAAEKRAALQDYERRLEAEAAALENAKVIYAQQQAMQQSAPVAKRQINTELVKSFTDSVFNGEENANEKLLILLNDITAQQEQAPTQQVDSAKIAELASAQALARMQQQREQDRYLDSIERGKDWLLTSHPEVAADPMLYNMINLHTNTVAADNPGFTPELVIKTAAEAVLSKFGTKPPLVSTRADAKSSLPKPIKTLSSTSPASDDVDNMEETPQQVAEALRNMRNGYRNYST